MSLCYISWIFILRWAHDDEGLVPEGQDWAHAGENRQQASRSRMGRHFLTVHLASQGARLRRELHRAQHQGHAHHAHQQAARFGKANFKTSVASSNYKFYLVKNTFINFSKLEKFAFWCFIGNLLNEGFRGEFVYWQFLEVEITLVKKNWISIAFG